jgi:dihydroneopterin aldolase
VTVLIALRGLRVTGRHGVYPAERASGQPFVVDALLTVDAAAADQVTATVDYGVVAARLADVVAGPPVQLLETLAGRLADTCLALSDRVRAVVLTVHKPEAPIEQAVADVAVTVRRSRD